ncbi:hypothetical protein [Massilia eurypsychrophila]|uniref:hypothetical protein n=1 Tax=Massilia eurypsychrophila TaxID=1485217 RepID=UPI001034BEF7|nr:hypothetical protein [Massilia eurypsychrophila]
MQVPHQVYLDLAFKLRNMGDTRDPDEAVVAALKAWLAGRQAGSVTGRQPMEWLIRRSGCSYADTCRYQ